MAMKLRDRIDLCSISSLQDFVVGLSVLVRGSLEEKLRWTFSLYDQGCGYINPVCIPRGPLTIFGHSMEFATETVGRALM